MMLAFSSLFFPRNDQLNISHDGPVPTHEMCLPVADLTFHKMEEQSGEEIYEAGPAGRKNSG